MKKSVIAGGFLALSLMASNAATYAVSNGSGAAANGIGNSSGAGLVGTGGSVAIGVFSSSADFGSFTSAAGLLGAFSQYGAAGNFLASGLFGNKGTFTLSSAGTAANASFSGQNIYLLVGNGATLQSSTEFLVLKSAQTFLATDDASGSPIDAVFGGNLTPLLGKTTADLKTTSADTTVNSGYLTVALVPEPSALLLGAVGALGLLRRRR